MSALACLALLCFPLLASSAPRLAYAVADASGPFPVRVIEGAQPPGTAAVASGSYDAASYTATGWALLTISANSSSSFNASLAAYGAGFLEGFLTQPAMSAFASNTGALEPNSARLDKFLEDNLAWMRSQVAALAARDSYWAHLGTVLDQIQGLVDGQAAAGGKQSFKQVYQGLVNGGDIFNLAGLYGVSAEQLQRTPVVARLAAAGRLEEQLNSSSSSSRGGRTDHCSALVRLTEGNADIVVAHTTWSGLENMGRALKRYDLALSGISGSAVPGRFTALSGYPGLLQFSSDDMYVLGSGLVTLETTIDNDNKTLAKEYKSTAVVLEWLRNVLANRLATDGPSWAALFSKYASGTYTNSWMIVDSNLFQPGQPPPANTLTVLEEMPGNIVVRDRTPVLNGEAGSWPASPWGAGTWASFNVVSDERLFVLSGQQQLVDEYGGEKGPGAFFTLLNTSRANIFRREAPSVQDLPSMQRVIRYNEFKTDPLSRLACGVAPPYSATNAIADRR